LLVYVGVDLTGSVHGAGGVGGLVGVTPQGNGTHFAAFDGNGNVIALVSGSGGSASANYEYGPFAEPIRQSGSMADLNAVRYSTRFSDSQSDLLYVGYRFFSPLTGRWLRRDPAQERYEANLYRFVANNPISFIDPWGLAPSFSSDFGKCKLYARVNWTVTFLQPRNLDNIRKIPDEKARSEILSNLSWSDEEMQNWKRVAKNIVQYYFNEQPFKCVPCTKPCTTCPGGITVVVSLDFDGGDNVSVEKPNRERDDSTHLSANSIETGESEYGGNLYYQVTILHEVGHQLGMTHPGQKIYPRAGRNLAADYNADPDSLMGLGLTLRKEDFDQAFCRRILSPNAGCNPWKATEK
jgi:RHS repeat-associated protein